MRILMVSRETLFSSPGGDTTQIINTAKYLRLLGCDVDIEIKALTNYSQYDLIHFFNIARPDDILVHVTRSKLPFVVSTIFVDYSEYDKLNRTGLTGLMVKYFSPDLIEYVKTIARFLKNGDKIKSRYFLFNRQKKSIKYLLKHASLLLPNSHSEYNRLVKVYGQTAPYKKVVNAIDVDLFNEQVLPNEAYKNHVLCVGRIEGRKNQLNLIKAIMGTNLQLTIIGKPSPNHLKYYEDCRKLASSVSNVHFISQIEHQQLVPIYKAAKVHVLPSWFETTGLSSLEAGIMDCNVVVTPKGDTMEYFTDMAYYCQPDDIESIRNAVIKAYHDPVNSNLKPFIVDNYTWDKTASQTFDAYKLVLSQL